MYDLHSSLCAIKVSTASSISRLFSFNFLTEMHVGFHRDLVFSFDVRIHLDNKEFQIANIAHTTWLSGPFFSFQMLTGPAQFWDLEHFSMWFVEIEKEKKKFHQAVHVFLYLFVYFCLGFISHRKYQDDLVVGRVIFGWKKKVKPSLFFFVLFFLNKTMSKWTLSFQKYSIVHSDCQLGMGFIAEQLNESYILLS